MTRHTQRQVCHRTSSIFECECTSRSQITWIIPNPQMANMQHKKPNKMFRLQLIKHKSSGAGCRPRRPLWHSNFMILICPRRHTIETICVLRARWWYPSCLCLSFNSFASISVRSKSKTFSERTNMQRTQRFACLNRIYAQNHFVKSIRMLWIRSLSSQLNSETKTFFFFQWRRENCSFRSADIMAKVFPIQTIQPWIGSLQTCVRIDFQFFVCKFVAIVICSICGTSIRWVVVYWGMCVMHIHLMVDAPANYCCQNKNRFTTRCCCCCCIFFALGLSRPDSKRDGEREQETKSVDSIVHTSFVRTESICAVSSFFKIRMSNVVGMFCVHCNGCTGRCPHWNVQSECETWIVCVRPINWKLSVFLTFRTARIN